MPRSQLGRLLAVLISFVALCAIAATSNNKPAVPGEDAKALALYGCETRNIPRGSGYDDNPARLTSCILYDPNSGAHFVVSSVVSLEGVAVSTAQEK